MVCVPTSLECGLLIAWLLRWSLHPYTYCHWHVHPQCYVWLHDGASSFRLSLQLETKWEKVRFSFHTTLLACRQSLKSVAYLNHVFESLCVELTIISLSERDARVFHHTTRARAKALFCISMFLGQGYVDAWWKPKGEKTALTVKSNSQITNWKPQVKGRERIFPWNHHGPDFQCFLINRKGASWWSAFKRKLGENPPMYVQINAQVGGASLTWNDLTALMHS